MNLSLEAAVLTCAELGHASLIALLVPYGLTVNWIAPGLEIPGSYWGETEAGLIGDHLFVRDDTPVHSALHEACHYICMDAERRARLHTDAGGQCAEENGVCYLQILLADVLPGVGQERMFYRYGRLGLHFPTRFGTSLVRTGRRGRPDLVAPKRSDRFGGSTDMAGAPEPTPRASLMMPGRSVTGRDGPYRLGNAT